jgi:hypothetical protein
LHRDASDDRKRTKTQLAATGSRPTVEKHMSDLVENGAYAVKLAAAMPNKEIECFDDYVPEGLLSKANASSPVQ